MMYKILDKINSPKDLKNLKEEEIFLLAKEIRKFLIKNISKSGGHLASNLGVVELTLALHSVFDTKKDKIVFDVGHQSYVHKILTGRREKFGTIRQYEGLSGFPKRNESEHDCFETGHSSTSISAALGMAFAGDIKGDSNEIIALIGDGALTGGLALEGLNHLGSSDANLLVVLNDNEMSICENVGGLSDYLCNIRINTVYRKLSKHMIDLVSSVPIVGVKASQTAVKIKDGLKHIVMPGALFDEMGVKYFGPIDGHDYKTLVRALEELKKIKGPKLLHVITKKGKGYKFAEEDPSSYHGVGKFEIDKGVMKVKSENYSQTVGETLEDIFNDDTECLAITAAMANGTGLENLKIKYPKRVIDVGIAEGHATTLAAGIASTGTKAYFAVYSTFLQRGFDEIIHDVALQNLPVTLLIDRAGLVGEDGETHHGMFDLSYLNLIPNLTIFAPKDKSELRRIIKQTHSLKTPVAIRYPRGNDLDIESSKEDDIFKWETLKKGTKIAILATGKMVHNALKASRELETEYNIRCEVVNSRIIKPLDIQTLEDIARDFTHIFTLEDNSIAGGFGQIVLSELNKLNFSGKAVNIALPDSFIEHGSVDILYDKYGLSSNKIKMKVLDTIGKTNLFEEIS
ncbi:1-deoxy-D-xylulose-5-phosphate synthase [Acetoanaerobium pronyense]|uniref:1-deoxy-D-xylulose-5-phosphate synthase n=2 Tax=Acetoanaerobium pronyense TaxID=1482736 RepID=A0ABS4KIJ4_9FIRM|nr:1-deoxy-D-xylulose-5-phosphate synthase [Acetoanaerobium pronyense]